MGQTIGASNVIATVSENAGFETTEKTTCTNTASGNVRDGPCQGGSGSNNPNLVEETCKTTTNKGGQEIKGDKFSGCT